MRDPSRAREGRDVHEALKARGVEVVDTTCPFVRKIHAIVQDEEAQGRTVFIFGDPNHAEVKGIAGWCREARVFRCAEDLAEFAENCPSICQNPISVVAQTTSNRAKWEKFVKQITQNMKVK